MLKSLNNGKGREGGREKECDQRDKLKQTEILERQRVKKGTEEK